MNGSGILFPCENVESEVMNHSVVQWAELQKFQGLGLQVQPVYICYLCVQKKLRKVSLAAISCTSLNLTIQVYSLVILSRNLGQLCSNDTNKNNPE